MITYAKVVAPLTAVAWRAASDEYRAAFLAGVRAALERHGPGGTLWLDSLDGVTLEGGPA